VDRILEACDRHGKAAGFMATSIEEGQALLKQGFGCLEYWGDSFIYRQALREATSGLKRRVASQKVLSSDWSCVYPIAVTLLGESSFPKGDP
jgi:hypothetical protein